MGVEKYRDLLLALFPRGRAWVKEKDTLLFDTCEGMAVEFSRAEQRASDLFEELDPTKTFELLPEWERLLGLPDECAPNGGTLSERLNAIYLKLTARGGNTMSRQFFNDLALSFGYDVTISETFPFRVGRNRCNEAMWGVLWKFWFQVITDAYVTEVFRTGLNRAGDRLRSFHNTALECVIRRAIPAHTNVQFIYGS